MNFFSFFGITVLIALLGFMSGMKVAMTAYDFDLMNDNVLEMTLQSYRLGCDEAKGTDCKKKALKHYDEMKKIIKKDLFKNGTL